MANAAVVVRKQSAAENDEPSSVFLFGRSLGAQTRKTLAESEELHKAYLRLNDADRRSNKLDFMTGYVMGVLSIQQDMAETVIVGRVRYGANPQPAKPARTKEQQNAFDAARKMFSFHIARDDKRVIDREAKKQVRLSAEFKESAVSFVGEFFEEVNKQSIDEVIKMLKVLKGRITKVLAEQ